MCDYDTLKQAILQFEREVFVSNWYLERTLSEAEAVVSSFRYVAVDWKRLVRTAKMHAELHFELPSWNAPLIYPVCSWSFVSHCFWSSVINFCFSFPSYRDQGTVGKFSARGAGGTREMGAYAMHAVFYRNFGERYVLARDMRPLLESFSKFKKAFRGTGSTMPLMRKRYEMLLEACRVLEAEFGGDPFNVLADGNFAVEYVWYGRGFVAPCRTFSDCFWPRRFSGKLQMVAWQLRPQ